MISICMGSVVGGVVVTDMVGDIGTGVVVVVYWTRAVGGVHSMVTVELSLPFTTSTTLTSAGAGAEKGHQSNTICVVRLNYINMASLVSLDLAC